MGRAGAPLPSAISREVFSEVSRTTARGGSTGAAVGAALSGGGPRHPVSAAGVRDGARAREESRSPCARSCGTCCSRRTGWTGGGRPPGAGDAVARGAGGGAVGGGRDGAAGARGRVAAGVGRLTAVPADPAHPVGDEPRRARLRRGGGAYPVRNVHRGRSGVAPGADAGPHPAGLHGPAVTRPRGGVGRTGEVPCYEGHLT